MDDTTFLIIGRFLVIVGLILLAGGFGGSHRDEK
jgi:hypothetical protein